MTNYNEWLIESQKPEDHVYVSLNGFELERLEFFTICFYLVDSSQKGLGSLQTIISG